MKPGRISRAWGVRGVCCAVISLLGALSFSLPLSADVTVNKTTRQLFLNGQPFVVRGVNYAPDPAGSRPPYYNLFDDPAAQAADFPLIKMLGANTIRVFAANQANTATLDRAWAQGLYVIMGYPVDGALDITNASVRANLQADFLSMVNAHKSHPAVLMWGFGNEVRFGNAFAAAHPIEWYSLVEAVGAATHAADPHHPFSTVISDLSDLDLSAAADAQLPSLDVWGVNVYRGVSMDTFFSQYLAKSSLPLLVAEFGADAYSTLLGREDQATQSSLVTTIWGQIERNSAVSAPSHASVGGVVFSWSDGWWKGKRGVSGSFGDGGDGGDFVQDTAADWTNNAYPDPGMNEEWWGLVAISTRPNIRSPRLVYYALRDLWANPPPVPQSGSVISSPVRNYPNPMRRGEGTEFRFSLVTVPDDIEVKVSDIEGRLLRTLTVYSSSGLSVVIPWDGCDGAGRRVSPGLCLATVRVRASGQEDVKRVRVVITP